MYSCLSVTARFDRHSDPPTVRWAVSSLKRNMRLNQTRDLLGRPLPLQQREHHAPADALHIELGRRACRAPPALAGELRRVRGVGQSGERVAPTLVADGGRRCTPAESCSPGSCGPWAEAAGTLFVLSCAHLTLKVLHFGFEAALLRAIAAEASLQRSALSSQAVIQRVNALTLVS